MKCLGCGFNTKSVSGLKNPVCDSCYTNSSPELRLVYKWVTDGMTTAKRQLYKRYGITIEDYARMMEQQQGKCYICKEQKAYDLYVDHNHTTNKVRKLLCNSCNSALGSADDSVIRLMKMIDYLKENE